MTQVAILDDGAGFLGADRRSGLARSWADYKTYRRTLAELRALTDRSLADLGMDRTALNTIAHQAVYGK